MFEFYSKEPKPPDLPAIPTVNMYSAVAVFLTLLGISTLTPWNDLAFVYLGTAAMMFWQIATNG